MKLLNFPLTEKLLLRKRDINSCLVDSQKNLIRMLLLGIFLTNNCHIIFAFTSNCDLDGALYPLNLSLGFCRCKSWQFLILDAYIAKCDQEKYFKFFKEHLNPKTVSFSLTTSKLSNVLTPALNKCFLIVFFCLFAHKKRRESALNNCFFKSSFFSDKCS